MNRGIQQQAESSRVAKAIQEVETMVQGKLSISRAKQGFDYQRRQRHRVIKDE
jgi:hypothetical protein